MSADRQPRTVLVIDDESLILKTASRLIGRIGYDVLAASSGLDGVAVLESSKGRIGLVLLDMVMPDMNGPETFSRLRKIDSDVRVVVTTGYNRDRAVDEMIESGAVGYLTKPYTLKELEVVLDRHLG